MVNCVVRRAWDGIGDLSAAAACRAAHGFGFECDGYVALYRSFDVTESFQKYDELSLVSIWSSRSSLTVIESVLSLRFLSI